MPDTSSPTRGRSPGAGWTQVTHGIHVLDDDQPTTPLRGWQLLLPDHGCFTHLTAAGVRGWWLPPLPSEMPVFMSVGQRDPRPLRSGVRCLRLSLPCAVEVLQGVRIAIPIEILLACAQDLGLVDVVLLIDAAAYAGDIDLADLRVAVATTLRRRRGVAPLRRALALASDRSESPWETLLRLLHVVCGIEVQPQYELLGDNGSVARADLWLVGTRSLHEYDGEVHLPRAAQRRDLRRLRRITGVEWVRRGYTSDDVLARAVSILRDADAAVGRDHRPERIRAWHELLRESLFTPAGTARVLARLAPTSAA
jgi:hypothetical protein